LIEYADTYDVALTVVVVESEQSQAGFTAEVLDVLLLDRVYSGALVQLQLQCIYQRCLQSAYLVEFVFRIENLVGQIDVAKVLGIVQVSVYEIVVVLPYVDQIVVVRI